MDAAFDTAGLPHRLMRRVAALPPVTAALSASVQRSADDWVYRLSRGRWTASSLFSGLPVLLLTTTGAKSGQTRTFPLLALPYGEALVVIGSNYGQPRHPAWSFNLRANPDAQVKVVGGPARRVRARAAREQERTEIWETAVRIYPGWAGYQKRAAGRVFPIFVLEPRDNG